MACELFDFFSTFQILVLKIILQTNFGLILKTGAQLSPGSFNFFAQMSYAQNM